MNRNCRPFTAEFLDKSISAECLQSWQSMMSAERRSTAAHLAHQWLTDRQPEKKDHQDNCRLVTLLLQKLALKEDSSSNSSGNRWHTDIRVLLQKILAVLAVDAPSLALRLLGTFRDQRQVPLPPSIYTVLLTGLSRTVQRTIRSWPPPPRCRTLRALRSRNELQIRPNQIGRSLGKTSECLKPSHI